MDSTRRRSAESTTSTKSRAEGAATTYKESTTETNVRFFTPRSGETQNAKARNEVSGIFAECAQRGDAA